MNKVALSVNDVREYKLLMKSSQIYMVQAQEECEKKN